MTEKQHCVSSMEKAGSAHQSLKGTALLGQGLSWGFLVVSGVLMHGARDRESGFESPGAVGGGVCCQIPWASFPLKTLFHPLPPPSAQSSCWAIVEGPALPGLHSLILLSSVLGLGLCY